MMQSLGPSSPSVPKEWSPESEGLSQKQLCASYGIKVKNLSARAKRLKMTSQELLEERTGWRFNESDRKYY